jgi:hypothetical protein
VYSIERDLLRIEGYFNIILGDETLEINIDDGLVAADIFLSQSLIVNEREKTEMK